MFGAPFVVNGLASALDMVRRLRKKHGDASTPLVVCVHPGTYELGTTLQMDQRDDSNTIWQAVGDQPTVRHPTMIAW